MVIQDVGRYEQMWTRGVTHGPARYWHGSWCGIYTYMFDDMVGDMTLISGWYGKTPMSTCGRAKYTIMIGSISRVDVAAPCDAMLWHLFCIIIIKKKKKNYLEHWIWASV